MNVPQCSCGSRKFGATAVFLEDSGFDVNILFCKACGLPHAIIPEIDLGRNDGLRTILDEIKQIKKSLNS